MLAHRRLHLLTKHRVFSGPGFLVAQEVGDSAHGGQVLLTHDAWLELRNDMDQVRLSASAQFDRWSSLGLEIDRAFLTALHRTLTGSRLRCVFGAISMKCCHHCFAQMIPPVGHNAKHLTRVGAHTVQGMQVSAGVVSMPDSTRTLAPCSQAGFPTIEQLGLFKLEAWGAPIWIYQARPSHPSLCALCPDDDLWLPAVAWHCSISSTLQAAASICCPARCW